VDLVPEAVPETFPDEAPADVPADEGPDLALLDVAPADPAAPEVAPDDGTGNPNCSPVEAFEVVQVPPGIDDATAKAILHDYIAAVFPGNDPWGAESQGMDACIDQEFSAQQRIDLAEQFATMTPDQIACQLEGLISTGWEEQGPCYCHVSPCALYKGVSFP